MICSLPPPPRPLLPASSKVSWHHFDVQIWRAVNNSEPATCLLSKLAARIRIRMESVCSFCRIRILVRDSLINPGSASESWTLIVSRKSNSQVLTKNSFKTLIFKHIMCVFKQWIKVFLTLVSYFTSELKGRFGTGSGSASKRCLSAIPIVLFMIIWLVWPKLPYCIVKADMSFCKLPKKETQTVPLTNGSGSCYFRPWPSRRQQNTIFF